MPPNSNEEHPFGTLNEPGLLTESDRRLLLGDKTYEDDQMERRARMRLRQRIQGGLKDFWFLTRCLSEEDRRQLLADPTAQIETPNEVFRESELQGLVDGIAFFFALAADVNVEYAELVRLGLLELYSTVYRRPLTTPEVSIQIAGIPDLDDLVAKIESEEPLTWVDFHDLKAYLAEDWDRLVAATAHIQVPDLEDLNADEHLSLGKSLLLYIRSKPGDGKLIEAVEKEILHPTLLQDPLIPGGLSK